MAIAIEQQSSSPKFSNGPIAFTITSDNVTEPAFAFIVQIYENGVLVWSGRKSPDNNGIGQFDLRRPISDRLTTDVVALGQPGLTIGSNAGSTFQVRFGEVFRVNEDDNTLTEFPALASTNNIVVIRGTQENNIGDLTDAAAVGMALTNTPTTGIRLHQDDFYNVSYYDSAQSRIEHQAITIPTRTTTTEVRNAATQASNELFTNTGSLVTSGETGFQSEGTTDSTISGVLGVGVPFSSVRDIAYPSGSGWAQQASVGEVGLIWGDDNNWILFTILAKQTHSSIIRFTLSNVSTLGNITPETVSYRMPGSADWLGAVDAGSQQTFSQTVNTIQYDFTVYTERSFYGEVRFVWINRLGGFSYFTADFQQTENVGVTKRTSNIGVINYSQAQLTNKESANDDVFFSSIDNYGIDLETTKSIQTGWITFPWANYIAEIFTAQQVWAQVGDKYIPLEILNPSYIVPKDERIQGNFNYTIMFREANDKTGVR